MIVGRPAPRARLALIHSDPQRADALARLLRPSGHTVNVFGEGMETTQAVLQSDPDLLIVAASVEAPPLEVLVSAVRQSRDIPVIVIVGERVPNIKIEADAVLSEPPIPAQLSLLVAGLLRPADEIRRLRRKVEELAGLYKISWAFSLEGGREPLYRHLAQHCSQLLKSRACVIWHFDKERRRMVAQPGAAGVPESAIESLAYGADTEAQRWNFRTNGPLLTNQAPSDSRVVPQVVESLGVKSLMATAMTRGPRILGVLCVADRHDGAAFGEEDLSLLMAVAGLAAVAVENLRLHEDLKSANTMLQEYDRMKSEFVAMIAHDFRRPLTSIRGFSELALEDPDLPSDTLQDYMQTIITETDALARLADDTLLITRMETERFEFRFEEVDFGPFALDAVPLGLSQHTVLVDVPRDFPIIIADPDRLRQVLTNLISNAIKYSPHGGTITIRCRLRGEQVVIEVQDQGLGVPKDQVSRLFHKFERVRSDEHLKVSGTGLGLYICRLIVEGHGGQIWVESTEGKGSNFGMVLPRNAAEAHAAQKARREATRQNKAVKPAEPA